jgi:hypothetical protein
MNQLELQYQLVEYLGISTGTFNSGFNGEYKFKDSTEARQKTKMFNWFLPPAYQFPNGFKTEIGEWRLTRELLQSAGVHFDEVGLPPKQNEHISIFLPFGQNIEWGVLTSLFGPPQLLMTGYLTPSGRSFWVTGPDKSSFGLKFHIRGTVDPDSLLEKSLDLNMLQITVEASEQLSFDPAAMNENYGCFFKIPNGESTVETGYLLRNFKWEKLGAVEGDLLLPVSALLSHKLWSSDELRRLLQLPQPAKMSEWFVAEMAPHFSLAIETSLFETGIHPEMHQQNLTVHLRSGKIIRLICQDLQDCLYDPVTRFLLANQDGLNESCNFSLLGTQRIIALPGEILTPDNKEKLFVQLADWWRRWLRIFGRYDRVINLISGRDLFGTKSFEDAIAGHLIKACSRRGLSTAHASAMDLYQLIGWTQFQFQQKLLSQTLEKSEIKPGENLPEVFDRGSNIASARAPWNNPLLQQWLVKNECVPGALAKGPTDFFILKGAKENHIYFLRKRTN